MKWRMIEQQGTVMINGEIRAMCFTSLSKMWQVARLLFLCLLLFHAPMRSSEVKMNDRVEARAQDRQPAATVPARR